MSLPSSEQDTLPVPEHHVLVQAAEWYAALRDEAAVPASRRAWQEWLAQSPEHARAWHYIEAAGRRFDLLRSGDQRAAAAGLRAARTAVGRRRVLGGLASIGGLGLAAWMGWRHMLLPDAVMAWGADFRTAVGERRELTLVDGTRIWINTDSALNVDYRLDGRHLRLLTGEILVQTGADEAGRPFFVDTRNGRLQPLGTRFSVYQGSSATHLEVFEHNVEILTAAGQSRRVAAGQRVEFSATLISPVEPASVAREAWSRGVLLANDISLLELVGELNRYRRGHIAVSPEVAGLSVVGVYPADDPEHALDMLAGTLPIRIRRPLAWWYAIEPR